MKKNKKENPIIYILGIIIILSSSLFFYLKKDNEIEKKTIKIGCSNDIRIVTKDVITNLNNDEYIFDDSDESFKKLLDKDVDIIISRELTDEQLLLAKEKNIELEIKEIFRDKFVFFVSKDNLINNISYNNLLNVYSGRVDKWSNNSQIFVLYEKTNSTTREKLLNILANNSLKQFNQFELKDNNNDLINSFNNSNNNQLIGYTYLHNINNKDNLKLLSIDNINPLDVNYNYYTSYYIVNIKNENNKKILNLKNDILSLNVQEIIEKNGYFFIKNDVDNN